MEDNNKGRNGLLKQGVDKLFNTFEEKYGADFSDEGCQNALNFLDNMDKFLLTAFAPLYSEISYIGEIFSNIKMGYEETKGIKENTQEYMKNESENLKNYFGDAITEGINFGREVGGEIFTGLAAEQSKVFSIYNFVDDLKDRFNATKEFIGQTKEFIDKSKEIKATLDEQVRQELTYNLSDKEENIDIDDIYEKIKDTDSKENEESNQDIENENKELNETEGKEIGSIEESELEDLQKEKEMIESWKEHPYYDRLMNSEKQANEDRLSEIREKIGDTDSKENKESILDNDMEELNDSNYIEDPIKNIEKNLDRIKMNESDMNPEIGNDIRDDIGEESNIY